MVSQTTPIPSSADLTPEQRHRLHPDFLANEQAYARLRPSLLRTHRGQWVAVRGEEVVAAGDDLLAVSDAAAAAGGHPFIARVGEEGTVFRIRRSAFPYDTAYQPFTMPRIPVTFWNDAGSLSQTYPDVIPDTGADVSALPDADCAAFDLYSSPCLLGQASGIAGAGATALIYRGRVEIDGLRLTALIQPIRRGRERMIGRDVLNQCRVTFDGPGRQVSVDP